MLRLVAGVAGTGKTTALLDVLKKRAKAKKSSILLVPEQFSSSAESMVYRHLGEAPGAFVQVLSFRTLGQRILRLSGGAGTPVLEDAGRVVMVRRALDTVAGQLRAFSRQRRSAAFCHMCAQTLLELKTAGATPALVQAVANQENDDKLREISLIFEAYEAVLAGSAMDPDDKLSLAAGRADCGFFAGQAVFADSFDGFTAPEYEMLEQMLRHCEEVTVSLCCDTVFAPGAATPDLFSPVRRAAMRLQRMAQRTGAGMAAPVVLGPPCRTQNAALLAVNTWLATGDRDALAAARAEWFAQAGGAGQKGDGAQMADGVAQVSGEFQLPGTLQDGGEKGNPRYGGFTLTAATDEWEEVSQVAAEMRRLALAGVPYSKMALVCRDVAAYERVVRRQLALYDVPCFIDASTTIEHTAPVAFLRAALGLLRRGLNSPDLLALLKSGLCGVPQASLAALENYVFTWAPKAAEWRSPFVRHPDGLLARASAEADHQRRLAEEVRAMLVPEVEVFLRRSKGKDVRDLFKQLYLLMDHFKADEHIEHQAARLEAEGDVALAQQARRAYDVAMELMDQMVRLLGGEVLRAEEVDELLLLLVRATDFGQPPQAMESVSFSGADRMRLSEPDYCFVVGLCEGEFPMKVGYSGLLNHDDRDKLVRGGVEMPGSFETRSMLEELYFYRALTAPRHGLYLSWPRRRAGEAKSPSVALDALAIALEPPRLSPPLLQAAATPRAAYDLLARKYRQNTPQAAVLMAALATRQDDETRGALGLLQAVDNPGVFSVSHAQAVERLVGRELVLSATSVERYHQCQFSYFMERVLRVEPRRKAELSPLESGTFVHHVLEQVLAELGAEFAHCPDERLKATALRHADAFIAQHLPDDTRRTAFRLGQMKDTTVRLLLFMRDAAAHSLFSVDALELGIGADNGVPALEVATEKGRRLKLVGKVDRVDTLHQNGHTYLCIVDYKTGNKTLELDELYCGMNMQMMVYMDALCQNGGKEYPDALPAGVLYLTSDPAPASTGRQGGALPVFRLNGLVLDEPEVLRALDGAGDRSVFNIDWKGGTPKARGGLGLATAGQFAAIQSRVRALLAAMADGVYDGRYPARPLVKKQKSACRYCPYRVACRHEDGLNEQPVQAPADAFAVQEEAEGEKGGEAGA